MPIGYQPGIRLAPPWSPLLLSGLRGFWQADVGVTTPGGTVTQWNDQSGYGNNLVPSIGTVTHSNTGFNSVRPGVILSASTGLEKTGISGGWDNTGMLSVFWLGSFASIAGFGSICGMRVSNADTTNGTVLGVDAGNFALCQDRATSALFANGEFSVPSGDHLLIATRDCNGLCHFYIDGAEQGTANSIAFSYTPAHWEFGTFPGMLGNIACTTAFWGITSFAMNQGQIDTLKRYSLDTWGASI